MSYETELKSFCNVEVASIICLKYTSRTGSVKVEMSNELDFYWVQSIWAGLDSEFWTDFWARTGWTNFCLGWTDRNFIWRNGDGLDLTLWMGLDFWRNWRTKKMPAKRSNMPYCKPNFLRFDHLHQFYPFQVSPNERNYDFVAQITIT